MLLPNLPLNITAPEAAEYSAFIQQRAKIAENALPTLFHNFNAACSPPKLFKGYQLLACDGAEFAFYSDWDWDARVTGPNGYHAVHLVALYDLISRKYIDAEIQPARLKNEHKAICSLAQKLDSATNKIFVADRGFGSYNFYANAEAADISYVVRLTDKNAKNLLGPALFDSLEQRSDITVTRFIVRHKRKSEFLHQDAQDDYRYISPSTQFDFIVSKGAGEMPITLRIVRVKLSNNTFEYLATNLSRAEFPITELKKIYRLRWGIETSFRDLKHTLGAEKFRSRNREFVIQEIWSRMILYNFCMEIVQRVSLKKQALKYEYRINLAQAFKTCHEFLRSSSQLRQSMDVLGWIVKTDACPVRDGRSYKRKPKHHSAQSLNYR